MALGQSRIDIPDELKVQTTRKNRTCLGLDCGELFLSSGPGNRLCPKCTRKNKTVRDCYTYKLSGGISEED